MKIILLTFFVVSSIFLPVQKRELDTRLVGKWTMLFTLDANGEIVKDDFYGKRYVETYTKDGRWVEDPQFFRDDMKRGGVNIPLDYSEIPTLQWKTINNEILEMNSDLGSRQNRYGFAGDTLIFGYPNGNTRYLLKRK